MIFYMQVYDPKTRVQVWKAVSAEALVFNPRSMWPPATLSDLWEGWMEAQRAATADQPQPKRERRKRDEREEGAVR